MGAIVNKLAVTVREAQSASYIPPSVIIVHPKLLVKINRELKFECNGWEPPTKNPTFMGIEVLESESIEETEIRVYH